MSDLTRCKHDIIPASLCKLCKAEARTKPRKASVSVRRARLLEDSRRALIQLDKEWEERHSEEKSPK